MRTPSTRPQYRMAFEPGKSCETCDEFVSATFDGPDWCALFNDPADRKKVCKKWKALPRYDDAPTDPHHGGKVWKP